MHNCIGNSGPLKPEISAAVKAGDLTACAVLSGNRNFEGRVHPETRMNFLASPPLVVAYALAGTLDIDLTTEPLGTGKDGKPVHLADIWPSDAEVQELLTRSIDSQMFRDSYASVFKGDEHWASIQVPAGQRYAWDAKSTYVKHPPYFDGHDHDAGAARGRARRARARASSATRSPPITSPRPATSRAAAPRRAISSSREWSPRISTPTARAAATMRS